MAEIVAHVAPRAIELHNYSRANAAAQKVANWDTLNAKVLAPLSLPCSSRPACLPAWLPAHAEPGSARQKMQRVSYFRASPLHHTLALAFVPPQVFKKMGFGISRADVDAVVSSQPGAIEKARRRCDGTK